MSAIIPAQPVSRDVADESQRIVARLEASISAAEPAPAPAPAPEHVAV